MDKEIKHLAVSLITNDVREAGKVYRIITNLKSKKIKYLDNNGKEWVSYKNKGWKFLDKKYLERYDMTKKEKITLNEISFALKTALHNTSMNSEDKEIIEKAKTKLDNLIQNK